MTIEEMKDYFSHRELGLQEAAGEYAILVPLVQWEGQRCLLFETRADTLVGHQPGEVCFPGGRREHGRPPGRPPCGRPGRRSASPRRRSGCWPRWT